MFAYTVKWNVYFTLIKPNKTSSSTVNSLVSTGLKFRVDNGYRPIHHTTLPSSMMDQIIELFVSQAIIEESKEINSTFELYLIPKDCAGGPVNLIYLFISSSSTDSLLTHLLHGVHPWSHNPAYNDYRRCPALLCSA